MSGRVFLFLLISVATLAGQTAPRIRQPAVAPITAISVVGNKTLGGDAILDASGLKINENGSAAIFDAARDRLLDTGYFDAVSYSFHQQSLGFAITFTIRETTQVFPIEVEALPITVAQITQVLKSKFPLFAGQLPGAKSTLDRAAAIVEQNLASANPDLRVRAKVVMTGPESLAVRFAPAEGLPVIADVTFEGSKVIGDKELHSTMIEGAIGQDVSDTGIRLLLDRLIRPLFEKQGYMRVSFPRITMTPAKDVKGIDVHVVIVDGPQFRLGEVSVRGPMAGDERRILRMANLKSSDFINFDEFVQGASRIQDTLRSEGYLDVTVTTGRSIDDARQTVDAWFDVQSGDVYTFGHLEVVGLGLDGEAAIRKMWTVKSGDPYPGAYPDHFVKAVQEEGLFDNLGAVTATPTVNRQSHTVDVSLHFATAPPAARQTSRAPF